MERNYVIVCNEHSAWPKGALLLWGHRTADDEKRSFGGYTTDFTRCELYTREELEAYRGNDREFFLFYDELKDKSLRGFLKQTEVFCTLQDLESLGYRVWPCLLRP